MALTFLNKEGKATEFKALLPELEAGQSLEFPVKFRSDYYSPVALDFMLEGNDQRVKIVSHTKRIEPREVGEIILEASSPADTKDLLIPFKLVYRARGVQ